MPVYTWYLCWPNFLCIGLFSSTVICMVCDGSHCYNFITIVNYHLEYCLICTVLTQNALYLYTVI